MRFRSVFLAAGLFSGVAATGTAGAQATAADDTGNKATLPVAAASGPADAPAAASAFTITGSAGILSQYRFRGISQSDNKPVVQGTFTVSHNSGLYLSVWGSSASANNAVNIGGTEIDVYGGFTHALGDRGVTIDAGVYGYIYPGSKDAVGIDESYVELYGSLAKSFGPAAAKVGVYWAPDQHYFNKFNTATQYNMYEYGELTFTPMQAPITLHGHVGHTGGGFNYAGNDYIDYTVGAGYKWQALTFDVSLVGTDLSRRDTRAADLAANTRDFRRAAKPVAVASVTASF